MPRQKVLNILSIVVVVSFRVQGTFLRGHTWPHPCVTSCAHRPLSPSCVPQRIMIRLRRPFATRDLSESRQTAAKGNYAQQISSLLVP
jgi:hypothetical protein